MKNAIDRICRNPRLVARALVPIGVLVLLLLATGGGSLLSGSSSSSPPAPSAPPPQVQNLVQGAVAVHAAHLHGSLWRFVYTVGNTGKTPIAGFQLNGPPANLFAVSARPAWAAFGSGVCNARQGGMLVYWSTGTGSPAQLTPGDTGRFAFEVNTTGTIERLYSLSWSQAQAQFGHVQGPAASTLPASGPCKA